MDVHGIDAEVTHNAHDDRELIIPDMPYSVRKAYQRWQEAVKAAELQDTPAPDCPYYVRTYLDEISAVKELRAAKAALETIRKQSGELYALDQEAWETFYKPSPFISIVSPDVENTDEAAYAVSDKLDLIFNGMSGNDTCDPPALSTHQKSLK